jgi:hypothetical protein
MESAQSSLVIFIVSVWHAEVPAHASGVRRKYTAEFWRGGMVEV